MIKVKCIKNIEMNIYGEVGEKLDAHFTVGKDYVWQDDCGGYIINDVGQEHYMPSPKAERDEEDGWATSDHFEVIDEI